MGKFLNKYYKIIIICLLVLLMFSMCKNCSNKQNYAFEKIDNRNKIDSLDDLNIKYKDSIFILNSKIDKLIGENNTNKDIINNLNNDKNNLTNINNKILNNISK